MTIDVENFGGSIEPAMITIGGRESPGDDDTALLALARSRMLIFYALQALPPQSLSVRPIGPAIGTAQVGAGRAKDFVVPLEIDDSTRSERATAQDSAAYYRRPHALRYDMLTGPVPGTDLILGMSRRLYSACRTLAAEEAALLETVRADMPDLMATTSPEALDEDQYEDQLRERRELFAEREADERDRLHAATREAYAIGAESSWQQLIDVQPRLDTAPPPEMLESATADVYLALSTASAAMIV